MSFRMSFSAVLALIAGYEAARPWLTRLRIGDGSSPGLARRAATHVVPLAFTSLLAGTASAPYAAAAFGHVQLYFIAANMLAVPLTALWVMPAGLLALALMPAGPGAARPRADGLGQSASPCGSRAPSPPGPPPPWPSPTSPTGAWPSPRSASPGSACGAPACACSARPSCWPASPRPLLSRPPDLLVSPDARLIAFHTAGQVFTAGRLGRPRRPRRLDPALGRARRNPLPDEGDPAPGLHCDPGPVRPGPRRRLHRPGPSGRPPALRRLPPGVRRAPARRLPRRAAHRPLHRLPRRLPRPPGLPWTACRSSRTERGAATGTWVPPPPGSKAVALPAAESE